MAVADPPQFLHEYRRRDNVASLTLNRLDKNRGHFLGGQRRLEQFFFDEAGAAQRERLRLLASTHTSAIHVGIANEGNTDRKSTHLNSSHSLHAALPISS